MDPTTTSAIGADNIAPAAMADGAAVPLPGDAVIPAAPAGGAFPPTPGAKAVTGSAISDRVVHAFDGITHVETGAARLSLLARAGIALGVVVLQVLLFLFSRYLFRILKERAMVFAEKRFKPLKVRKFVLLDKPKMIAFMGFLINIAWYVVIIFQLIITIPIVFSFFEPTKNLAATLFGYILTPLKDVFWGIITYIPNIFTIAVIVIVSRYLLRGLKFFAAQITRGKLVINGFYPEWSAPTYNLLRVLIIAFTVAMVYPYLPNSQSKIFQGVSMLVGVIFSFSSSVIVGNLISGIVMTYTRPFAIGDRIKVGDVTGFVVERSAMVTRIRTHKNEFVSFPNQQILTTPITNYSRSASAGQDGLILHAEVTFGYDTPWLTVHEVLITAAEKTDLVEKKPKPFVLQTALDDFYCHYEINFYTRAADKIPRIYSQLYQNIQDGFTEKGISCTAAHFYNVSTEQA